MYRIGVFSKLAQVPATNLRYYDNIGLFSPSYTDPKTGYRYYTVNQLSDLHKILVLRELGISIEQITHMLHDNISTDEIERILQVRHAQLEQQILEGIAQLNHIRWRLDLLKENRNPLNVLVKTVPEQYYFSTRMISPDPHHVEGVFMEMLRLQEKHQLSKYGYLSLVSYNLEKNRTDIDWALGYLGNIPIQDQSLTVDNRNLSLQSLPALELVASYVYTGRWTDSAGCYSRLGEWITPNGYEVIGPNREVFYKLENPRENGEVIVEVQIPIRVKSGDTPQ